MTSTVGLKVSANGPTQLHRQFVTANTKVSGNFFWQNPINFHSLIFRTSHVAHTELRLGMPFVRVIFGEAGEI
jgi:hypothetical protein